MLRLWPASLMRRTLLVLLLGVLGSNAIGIAIYSGDRLDALTSARGREIAGLVVAAATALQDTPEADRRRLLRAMRQPGVRLFWSSQPIAEEGTAGWRGRLIREAFQDEIGSTEMPRLRLSFDARGWPPPPPPPPEADEDPADKPPPHPHHWSRPPAAPPGGPALQVLVGSYRLDDGSWLNFAAPVATFPPFWETPYFLVVLGTTLVVLVITIWAVRRATQPLAMFAEAAERLGRDVHAPPVAAGGPIEVQRAAVAFNGMQQRLQRFVRDRTQMLAAISHDLRTPLTRLRLRAELIEDEEQQRKTIADLDEMRTMIDAALSFARDESVVEPPVTLDLAVLVQTVCEEMTDAGQAVSYEGPPHAPCVGRPTALKRAFANLMENAVTYGERARVNLSTRDGVRIVSIDDDGPGIPENELSRVFEPFRRLEASRSRETGGVGLGLAIVRTAIAAHGGRVDLANRPDGGLRATVTLPVTGVPATALPTAVSLANPSAAV